jgi:pimeloyl-ACP methyl ester carboxylesterase|tara:strand:+ start:638 stop:2209 length:1572 start_codon:yes stop_codon:yes gene_type:complete
MYSKVKAVIAGLIIGSVGGCATESAPAATGNLSVQQRCESLQSLTAEGVDLAIESAVYVSSVEQLATRERLSAAQQENFAPFCKITGYFEQRTGANGQSYAIGFGLSLPDDWNGRFLFQGGGGLNGVIREPIGALAAGEMPAVFRGFAVASTDSGHQSDTVFDPAFFADQVALLNFYSGAVEKTTRLAKQLVGDVYQQAPDNSYFVGCSTGGREAMTMSQRFPELFDGIVAGAPARRTNLSEIADLWSAKRLRMASASGNETPFSTEQQAFIVDELIARCDGLDGNEDGLIFDVEACDFTPQQLSCANNSHAQCLSADEVTALDEAFAGPKLPDGRQVYPGFYFDTGINAAGRGVPGLLQAVPGPLGQSRLDMPFDIIREVTIAEHFPLAPGNALLTNMSTFSGNGSKLMFFHGVSDPWFSAKDTLRYFKQMEQANGGAEAVAQWSQLYMVPGMGHCGGGERTLDQFDMLSAVVDWVEQSKAPASVVATGASMPGESRPLCPFPKVATYTQGDATQAGAYQCQ